MTIGEAAKRCGLSAHTIRYYEDAGVLRSPLRSSAGHRDYGDEQLKILRCVAALRRAGMSVADMRDLLRQIESSHNGEAASAEAMQRCVSILEGHRTRLADDAAELAGLVHLTQRALDALRKPECPF